jgi:hypothetical protein
MSVAGRDRPARVRIESIIERDMSIGGRTRMIAGGIHSIGGRGRKGFSGSCRSPHATCGSLDGSQSDSSGLARDPPMSRRSVRASRMRRPRVHDFGARSHDRRQHPHDTCQRRDGARRRSHERRRHRVDRRRRRVDRSTSSLARKYIGTALAFVRPRPSPSREARSSAIIIRAGTCPGHLRLLRGRTVV